MVCELPGSAFDIIAGPSMQDQTFNSLTPDFQAFAKLMRTLRETFIVQDTMVHREHVRSVRGENREEADQIIRENNFSVVPVLKDGLDFEAVYCTDEHSQPGARVITTLRPIRTADLIPDSTPLGEAFSLFSKREWYLTLRANRMSGLITYWEFNSRDFRLQLFAGLSRIEELSREILAGDGCGISDARGLGLSEKLAHRMRSRFEKSRKAFGGNRFVDELDFRPIYEALRQHARWREFLDKRMGKPLCNAEYDAYFDFTHIRNAVMHGRVLFPTYGEFLKCSERIALFPAFIDNLRAYLEAKGFSKHGEATHAAA